MRSNWLACLVLIGASANAVTIDFDTQFSSSVVSAASYMEDGYLFTASNPSSNSFAFWGTTYSGWTGSSAIFSNYTLETATLAALDGSSFSLLSFDASGIFPNEGASSLTFTGLRSDGSTISSTFTMDGVFGMQTFALGTTFSDVVSISWRTLTAPAQFDNFVIEPTSVPEPASFALLGLGLAGLGLSKRRERRNRPTGI